MNTTLQLNLPGGLTAIHHTAMATEWVFHLGGHDSAYLQQAAEEAFRVIDRLEDTLSLYRESSDVTRLNRAAANTEIVVGPDTLACLALAAEVAALTSGTFDPFTGRASLCAKEQPTPLHLLDAPGSATDKINGPVFALEPAASLVRKLRAGPWLDLGALGKGYALDQAAVTLADWDITVGCLVAGGSSLRGLGGAGWQLTLASQTILLPGAFSLGASGFDFKPGHIIDPRPTPTSSAAVRTVVLASNAALADALSTAAILLSAAELTTISQTSPDVSTLVFDQSGRAHTYGRAFA